MEATRRGAGQGQAVESHSGSTSATSASAVCCSQAMAPVAAATTASEAGDYGPLGSYSI